MDVFDLLSLFGGLSLFLYGMSLMGLTLQKRAAGSLKKRLSRLTDSPLSGFLTGLGVTAVIQSSSATTVMVVSLVDAGAMSLRQAIGVILGANVGTTVTAWLISLSGLSPENGFLRLLTPKGFCPLLSALGLLLYLCAKSEGKRDAGQGLLGFSILMTGMENMTEAVSGLSQLPWARELLAAASSPLLGVAAGSLLTAVLQSSSASVGMLQALAAAGQIRYGAALPIILGQNIGTCGTALLASAGTGKHARRAALIHLLVNTLGTFPALLLLGLSEGQPFLAQRASAAGIAAAHTAFNLFCTALFLPATRLLERLALYLIPENRKSGLSLSRLNPDVFS